MNKVLQAAGRVIWCESDFGLVLLIDSRYAARQYRALFPAHWAYMRFVSGKDGLSGLLNDFPLFDE